MTKRAERNQILDTRFFEEEPLILAPALLGKILRRKVTLQQKTYWLSARIIETEAYYLREKGSHSSLGLTESRKAMFMPAGTIYMYYARGSDSLNFSALGEGNAVLIKSGYAWIDSISPEENLSVMQFLNPLNGRTRPRERLCAGQTLLCRSLQLRVVDWNGKNLDPGEFYLADTGEVPDAVVQCTRLGIPRGRDEHLPYRFVDSGYARYCTRNPLVKHS